ncbi:MAG TPA: hypothetical protein VE622_05255 [Nitrososphaeraceae archaeon]|nr:hypothetical protein [Nitrososphaeraceae archaeon]
MEGNLYPRYMCRHRGARVAELALLGASALCFTKRSDFPYEIDKSAVDELIYQTYKNRHV